ncbi:hypothetical protein AVEN_11837-1 [Araneus ventricosus]|uniref:Uncharacterized protein n=1 Tax=Araneus ventricosus TaxID=182803 RepID=A0A4Y2K5K2_ARAVE|nr:hypothetical protein AVEN_11837-1 [Araneus ventricosus]
MTEYRDTRAIMVRRVCLEDAEMAVQTLIMKKSCASLLTENQLQLNSRNSSSDNVINISPDSSALDSNPDLKFPAVLVTKMEKIPTKKKVPSIKNSNKCLPLQLLRHHCANLKISSLWQVVLLYTVLTSPMFFRHCNHRRHILFSTGIRTDHCGLCLDRGVQDTDAKYILFVFFEKTVWDVYTWMTTSVKYRICFVMMGLAMIAVTFFTFPFATDTSLLLLSVRATVFCWDAPW